jgi:hypothetical protein
MQYLCFKALFFSTDSPTLFISSLHISTVSSHPIIVPSASTIKLRMKKPGFRHIVSYLATLLLPSQSLLSYTVMFVKSLKQLLAGKIAVIG